MQTKEIFCWCGLLKNSSRCLEKKHHLGKRVKEKQKPFSGYSHWREENGQSQAFWGR